MFDPDPFDRDDFTSEAPASSASAIEDSIRTAVFRDVLGTKAGRQFAREVLALCGLHRLSFSPDAALTAFREGERNVGLRLVADIGRLAPSALPSIMHSEDGK